MEGDDREGKESERGFASDPIPRLDPYPAFDVVLVSVFLVSLAGFVAVCGALMRWW